MSFDIWAHTLSWSSAGRVGFNGDLEDSRTTHAASDYRNVQEEMNPALEKLPKEDETITYMYIEHLRAFIDSRSLFYIP